MLTHALATKKKESIYNTRNEIHQQRFTEIDERRLQSSVLAREAETKQLTLDNYAHSLMQSQQRHMDKLYKKLEGR